jgi:hypothetical protein
VTYGGQQFSTRFEVPTAVEFSLWSSEILLFLTSVSASVSDTVSATEYFALCHDVLCSSFVNLYCEFL